MIGVTQHEPVRPQDSSTEAINPMAAFVGNYAVEAQTTQRPACNHNGGSDHSVQHVTTDLLNGDVVVCPVCNQQSATPHLYDDHWLHIKWEPLHSLFIAEPSSNNTKCKDSRCAVQFQTPDLLLSHIATSKACHHCHIHCGTDDALHIVSSRYCESYCAFADF